MQPSESLYEQKPEEPPAPVPASTNNMPAGPSLTSRFEYVENVQSSELNTGGSHMISHVSPPKSSSFFADFGMDGGFPKKSGSSSSKVLVSYMSSTFAPAECYLCMYLAYRTKNVFGLVVKS